MKLQISNIINIHKNSPALIVGHGPSYNQHKNRIQEYKNKGIIILDCNEWFAFRDVLPHYWIVASTEHTVQNYFTLINKYNVPFFYADSVDLTHRDFVSQILTTDYLPYDQRHNNCRPCDARGKCCDNIIPGRLTLAEEFMNYTKYNVCPQLIQTMILNVIIFAILMGCNPIYITGIDLDYRQGYAENTMSLNIPTVNHIDWKTYAIPNLKIINDGAKNIGIKIINLNKNSYFNTFEIGDING